jgi:hypothetical protein
MGCLVEGPNTPTLQYSIFRSCGQQAGAVERNQKIPFDRYKIAADDRRLGDQDEFHRLGEFVLVPPETFAEQTPRAAAFHRAADATAGDDAKLRRRAVRQPAPVGDETALRQPFALLPHAREITIPLEARFASQAQAFRRFGRHDVVRPALDVCGPRAGGSAGWRGHSWWLCGREIRAAVCGGFSMVDTGAS